MDPALFSLTSSLKINMVQDMKKLGMNKKIRDLAAVKDSRFSRE